MDFREICESCWSKEERSDFEKLIGKKMDERNVTRKAAKVLDAHALFGVEELSEIKCEKFWQGVVQQELG